MNQYLLLLLPCLLLTTRGLSQAPPTRPLGEFFSSLSGKELRKLANSRDAMEKAQISKALSALLESKEKGKKWTLKFISSGKTLIIMDNQISLSGDSEKSVRVNGEMINVRVYAEVPPSMADKVKECREGRKIFVSGKIKSLFINYGAPIVGTSNGRAVSGASRLSASITVAADDIGIDK